jgi:hypothetical protein
MSSEVDEHGIPLRGSALHIAYYVNCALRAGAPRHPSSCCDVRPIL